MTRRFFQQGHRLFSHNNFVDLKRSHNRTLSGTLTTLSITLSTPLSVI